MEFVLPNTPSNEADYIRERPIRNGGQVSIRTEKKGVVRAVTKEISTQ
jgi:hypothetical protein